MSLWVTCGDGYGNRGGFKGEWEEANRGQDAWLASYVFARLISGGLTKGGLEDEKGNFKCFICPGASVGLELGAGGASGG